MLTKLLDCFRKSLNVVKHPQCKIDTTKSLDQKSDSRNICKDASDDDQDGENDNSQDDVNDDDVCPRCDWDTIDSIPDSAYEELVSEVCAFSDPAPLAKRFAYQKGTFNAVSFVEVGEYSSPELYIVRVPGHATLEHWTARDTYMLKREVQIIQYIYKNRHVPVPQVCDYSTRFDNVLGHPYIMMTCLPGRSAYEAWFDEEYDEIDPKVSFRCGDSPSPAVEKKRIHFLRSLAKIMAEINTLSFNEIGMPILPMDGSAPPSLGPLYQWDNTESDESTERPVFVATQDLVKARPSSLRMMDALIGDNKTQNYILGARKLLDMIFAQPVFNSPTETFTLHHSDLDLQNILVDSDGNVTGIIDWDHCTTAPRCFGAASAPFFLQKDWMPEYLNNLGTAPHLPFTMHRYRQIYAAALEEVGCPDAKYTSKSAMYHAAVMALYDRESGDVHNFLEKVLRCVPEFRGDADEIIRAFGAGWPTGELMMERYVKGIFEPELPDSKVMAEALADIAAAEWTIESIYGIEDDDYQAI